jgi:hypothetical protein
MLREFKKQLNYARYVFVIGYSFKDDHLAKVCMCSCCNLECPDSTTNIIIALYQNKTGLNAEPFFVHQNPLKR